MGAVSDVVAFLALAGIVDGASTWPSVRRKMREGSNKLVMVKEDGGPPPGVPSATGVGSAALKDPGVLVTVRGAPDKGDAASAKAQEIFDALVVADETIGTGYYLRVAALTSEPVFVGWDEKSRPIFTIGFRLLASVL